MSRDEDEFRKRLEDLHERLDYWQMQPSTSDKKPSDNLVTLSKKEVMDICEFMNAFLYD